MIIGFIVVAILSGLPNGIASIFGTQLYTQPSWLPVLVFPWWICFGTIVTFSVAILFRSGREHHRPIAIYPNGAFINVVATSLWPVLHC
jgi:membrane protein implicated in regulation of membrane protease activity